MKLHQLQALVVVADTGSIRAAARLSGLSQTAVSKALRELERDQKLPLLARNANGVAFTSAGQKLLAHARLVISQLERADEELAEIRGEHVGRLTIAVTPWVMQAFIPLVLQRFRSQMPDIQLELFEGLSAVALPRLRDGAIDFAIVPQISAMPEQEFESERLVSFNSYVVARHDHPATHARSISELLNMDWAMNFTVSTYPAQMHDLFWQHGFDVEPRRLHSAHSATLLLELINQANMIGPCPEPLLLGVTGEVPVKLDIAEKLQGRTVSIIRRKNAVQGAAARCFVDCIRDVIRQRSRSSRPEDLRLFDMLEVLL